MLDRPEEAAKLAGTAEQRISALCLLRPLRYTTIESPESELSYDSYPRKFGVAISATVRLCCGLYQTSSFL
jgi:hypothetical protein